MVYYAIPGQDYKEFPKTEKWRDALVVCEKANLQTCTSAGYCKGGKPHAGVVENMWAPASDKNNEWVFIGSGKDQCKTWSEVKGEEFGPKWGKEVELPRPPVGKILCCPFQWKNVPVTDESKVGPTWAEASAVCTSGNTRLCRHTEVCTQGEGKPAPGGVLRKSVWTAVYDAENEWASIGFSFPHKELCKKYSTISPDKPAEWQTKRIPLRTVVKCCDDLFFNARGNMTYAMAVKHCATSSKQLCTVAEICPKGEGQEPEGGARPIVSWAPVSDSPNEWVQVGPNKNANLCRRHTVSQGKKPDWGEKSGTLGFVRCCHIPKPVAKDQITYAGAKQHCAKIGKQLCRHIQVCPKPDLKKALVQPMDGESWVPILDAENDWVYAGKDKPKLFCERYTTIPENKGKSPKWSVNDGVKGTIRCCEKDGSPKDPEVIAVKQPRPMPPPPRVRSPKKVMVRKVLPTKKAVQARRIRVVKQTPFHWSEYWTKSQEFDHWKVERAQKKAQEEKFKQDREHTHEYVQDTMDHAVEQAHKIRRRAKRIRSVLAKQEVAEAVAGGNPSSIKVAKEAAKMQKFGEALPLAPEILPIDQALNGGSVVPSFASGSSSSSSSSQSSSSQDTTVPGWINFPPPSKS